MIQQSRWWIAILLATGLMAANFLKLQAADEAWEELSGGLLGRIAQFEGVGGDSP